MPYFTIAVFPTPLMAALIPGQSPPADKIPIRFLVPIGAVFTINNQFLEGAIIDFFEMHCLSKAGFTSNNNFRNKIAHTAVKKLKIIH
jgi:hypothetical protein